MSVLKLNINDVPEPELVESGEYHVRLSRVERKLTKSGKGEYLNAIISISEENTLPIYNIMMLPDGGEYDQMRLLSIKRFCEAFGIEEDDGFEFDANECLIGVKGLTADVLIGIQESEGYEPRNVIKRWLR